MGKIKLSVIMVLLVLVLIACTNSSNISSNNITNVSENSITKNENSNQISTDTDSELDKKENKVGEIYLYGEIYGREVIKDKEIEVWKYFYHEKGMRHIFIEWPFFTAELLNIWMDGNNDIELNEILFTDYDIELEVAFFNEIKESCPDTIFHGTDVGHNYDSVGVKLRNYLKQNGLEESEIYELNEEAIEQGKHFHNTRDDGYREKKMIENFIREFDKLNGESIMGIYGTSHVKSDKSQVGIQEIDSMGYGLSSIYGEKLHRIDLSGEILKTLIKEPIAVGEMTVAEKVYEASYFGEMSSTSSLVDKIEFWRLENAYEDLKESEQTGEVSFYYAFPMILSQNEIYVVKISLKDGSTKTSYFLTDEEIRDCHLVVKEIIIPE